jgi:hypothetical protein
MVGVNKKCAKNSGMDYSKMDPREVGYYIYDLFNDNDSSQNNTASNKMINE